MPTAARRRRALLAGVALVAAIAGAVIGASSDHAPARSPPAGAGDPVARVHAARLSLDRAAGLLVILRFRGTTPPDYVLRALRRGRAGGAILFRDNLVSPPQLRALTSALDRAGGGRAVIAVDQEGGPVRRVPWAAPVAGQPEQLASGTVTAQATQGGRDLRAAGFNVVFAPVADVPDGPGSALAARGFSSDPTQAATAVAASVRAWLAAGVLPTLKHFPGLGGATANTDDAAVTVAHDAPTIAGADLAPFRAGIAAGAPLVMVSHAVYPALDPQNIASQSRPIITALLRDRLGFRGVVVTDSLEARAVTSRSSVATAAVRSVAAGADLVLTTGRGSFLPVLLALRARARRDPVFAARVREATGRVIALRAKLGG